MILLLVDGIPLPAVELLLDLLGVAHHGTVVVHVGGHRESLVVPLHQDARDLLQLFYVSVSLGYLEFWGQGIGMRWGVRIYIPVGEEGAAARLVYAYGS